MEYFKSDFLKVLYVFIVLFSFATGCLEKNEAIMSCESLMKDHFGEDPSLLSCVQKAIFDYTNVRDGYWMEIVGVYYPPVINDRSSINNRRTNISQDVYNYYMRMHTLVSPVYIDNVDQFCGRINAMKMLFIEESGSKPLQRKFPEESEPNTKQCIDTLRTFEISLPFDESIVENPIDYENFKSNSQYMWLTQEEFVLKKKILYNALYYYDLSGENRKGTYKGVYLEDIASKLDLINGNDYNPKRFCSDEHKEKKDEGTSISPL